MADGNSLAVLYALRTVVFVSGILAVMICYELRSTETGRGAAKGLAGR
jgi:hypothetical protein